jgi:3-hydroxyacyl-[acyl-carrier-protein] dehydratase|tara:strand:+ start:2219 stop:2692 length:474 start_codon:yes stop_codon:yes gene_type:complete
MKGFSLNCVELQEYQQNRYPYLMIDHVDEVIPGKSAKGYKNLTMNEWFFPKHFLGAPNMPGALQLEALAQMLTIAITTLPGNKGKTTRFISTSLKFRKEILPGDKLVIETKVNFWSRGVVKGVGTGYTNGTIACEAEMTITIPDILEQYLPKKRDEQ